MMKLNKRTFSTTLAFVAAAALMISEKATAGAGAYGSSAVTPTIYSKNTWYSVAPPVVGSVPAGATLGVVYYKWSYASPRPAGFIIYLCDNTGTYCGNITSSTSGSINFTATGASAAAPVRYYSEVSGTGTMTPLNGGSSTVTVNFNF